MSPAKPNDQSADFDELLVQLDESAADSTDIEQLNSIPEELDPELRHRLNGAKECIEMLDRVRRRSDPPSKEELDFELGTDMESEDKFDDEIENLSTVGKFRIEGLIGRGGLSLVYLAVDQQLNRKVALKVPRPEAFLTASLRRRFLREGETASKLEHDNIVRVFEAGQDGLICFIAAEYCPGGTLARWLEQQTVPIDCDASAEIVRKLADAVRHAHRRGILHRDIKPSNVMVDAVDLNDSTNTGDGAIRVRLTDFGVAKLLAGGGDETRPNTVVGTAEYMPPEQASGKTESVDVRSDVYALGAILYELICGRPCYRGSDSTEVLRRVLSEDPQTPREIRPEIPHDLEAICLKCLAREPDQRYATADALANDLGRFLNREPTVARPLRPLERGLKWARRHPAAATLFGVSVTSLFVILLTVAVYNARLIRVLEAKVDAQQNEAAARVAAEAARAEAEQQAVVMRRLLYAADMNAAFEALDQGNRQLATQHLAKYEPNSNSEDLRTFLWHYLKRRCDGEAIHLDGHRDSVYSVAFSTDGERIASAGADGEIIFWDTDTGERVATLHGNGYEINRIALSPDNKWLAAVGDDNAVRIWEMQAIETDPVAAAPVTIPIGGNRSLFAVGFSPDSRQLASGGDDNLVHLWNTADWSSAGELVGHEGHIESLRYSPDGSMLASASSDHTVKLWDVASQSELQTLGGHETQLGLISCVAFSHDGRRLVSCGLQDERSIVWDTQTGEPLAELRGHQNWVQGASFSKDDSLIATACKDGVVLLWDGSSYEQVARLLGHHGRVWNTTFAPQSQRLATAGADGRVLIWDIDEVFHRRLEVMFESPLVAMAIHPKTARMAVEVHGGNVYEVDLASGELSQSFQIPDSSGLRCLDYSPDGKFVVAPSGSDSLRLWSTTDWQLTREFPMSGSKPTHVRFSPNGKQLAIIEQDSRLHLLDIETGKEVAILVDDAGPLQCLAFSADGGRLAAAGETNHVRIWNLQTGTIETDIERFSRRIITLECSPKNDLIIFGGDERVIFAYDLADHTVHRLLGHDESILDVAFSPDGETFASCSEDGVVILWDRRSMQQVAEFSDQPGRTDFVGFSSDGRSLIVAGNQSARSYSTVEDVSPLGYVFIYSAQHR